MATNIFFILLFTFTCCLNAQDINGKISLTEVKIPGAITTGTYIKLIDLLGNPKDRYFVCVNTINHRCLKEGIDVAPKSTIKCEYLVYDAFEYIHVGDSVQLVFVDLRKAQVPIFINDLTITKKITQNVFLTEIAKRGWWSEEQSQYKVGGIESHYYTHSKVKNFGVDYKEDPFSSVIFTFLNQYFDKRIWWIEFPIMRIGGIVH